ncbi:TRAP transporter large permease [Geosporobacter ferrireducens]|uniref:C4-dicarboxylate ABC transporter permease n=1 Tax=Geosporobacter ferrireducens TaxID=1424294 RepID=A0A1D8GLV5_9FIRM|nr:TRAP transporter large permease [Geosporobacter ferrireducens]AOT71893.1 C4-dicarboxylate ABC transporter permease [Geosporobacter ferrireducens]MTI55683.1 TRAP transporter large permease [Geosporobacter ferrireducens]
MILFLSFVVLLALGVPIAITTGLATIIAMSTDNLGLTTAVQRMFSGVDSFSLMAIPFFVFSGDIMLKGGASKRLIDFANKLFGWITGGLPITAIISSMFFAALSGSSPATVAGVGGVMIPNLIEKNYPKKFTVGLLCAAGSLGIIIPPSITMMSYGVVSEQSISRLFIAAVIPGIFIGLTLMIYSYIYARISKHEKVPFPTFKEVLISFKDAFFSIMMPVIILGGIYLGFATPTEAAAVAIIYSLIISLFIYKEIKPGDVLIIAKKSVITSAMIMFVIATSKLFSWYLTFRQVPLKVADVVLALESSPFVILLVINVILLFVGMIMDSSAAVLILTPLFLPIVTNIGVNPIHFGVIMIVNLAIGMLTPPFGLNLFVASGIGNISISDVIKGSVPFIALLIFDLMVITFVPQLSLLLVK